MVPNAKMTHVSTSVGVIVRTITVHLCFSFLPSLALADALLNISKCERGGGGRQAIAVPRDMAALL